jgi:ribonuclease G
MRCTLVLSQVGDQTWGAVIEDGQVVELHVENARHPGVAGNIYKGRVSRVLPGMQSAFVEIGIERSAFLHVSDLPAARPGDFPFEPDEADEAAVPLAGPAPEELGLELGASREGADPRVETTPRGNGDPSERPWNEPASWDRPRALVPIQDLLREGQELVVQVAKEPIAAKGARVTAQVGLPGRLLVFMPHMERLFVSRRIEDAAERERLRALAETVCPAGGGWIIRTAAEGASETAIARDAAYLVGLWSAIQEREVRSGAPVLLHHDLSLAERLLRDVVTEEFHEVIVDSEPLLETARSFLGAYLSGQGPKVRRAAGGWLLFDELGIHQEIERSMRSRLWLRGGGSIVVNPTEALVAIDVNTGKYVGRKDLEETALRTNLEAAREIVRLLRLRDLGGIIVVDFIDMVESASREELLRVFHEELRKDRSRTKLLAMSDFGLVQLTRKRTRRSLDRILQSSCPSCGGSGRIRSLAALYYQIERDLARGAALASPEGPVLRLHPANLHRLDEEGLRFRVPAPARLGASADLPVRLSADPSLDEDDYVLDW